MVAAQVSKLDKATLIDGLAREGMTELLLHLAETEPPDDAVVAEQIKIAQHQIHYGDSQRSLAERIASFDQLVVAYRRLISQYRSHEQRPLWQTDLAELLMFEYLEGIQNNAAAFYEFGLPTAEQRSAFEAGVVEAYENLADADFRFAQLQTELPRQSGHVRKRIDTGLWPRMMDQYYQLRTQFLLAHAAYFVTLLPDTHAYYRNLGRRPKVRGQEQNVVEERVRLLELATDRIEPLARRDNVAEAIRRRSWSLAGRARTGLEDYGGALDRLERVATSRQGDLADLICRLAQASALNKSGQSSAAMDVLDLANGHGLAQTDLRMRLLVLDLRHRFKLAAALALPEKPEPARVRAVAEAYQPYQQLLNDPSLGSNAGPLKFYIYRRWESNLPADADIAQLPDLVVLGIAEAARVDGQNLTFDASKAFKAGDELQSGQLLVQARVKLARAVELLGELRERESVSPSVWAGGLFNLGTATYLLDESSENHLLDAARIWMELASTMPDQPEAERAIAWAVERLGQWPEPRSPAVQRAHQKAIDILFAKYQASRAADAERYRYAAFTLIPAGRLDEAVQTFADVPYGHPDYFVAQKEMLYALLMQYKAGRSSIASRIRADATRLAGETQQALDRNPGDFNELARHAAGHCRLALAELALAENDSQQALQHLDGVAETYRDDREVVRDALAKRVVALSAAGRLEVAVDEAQQMMAQFPDEASEAVDVILTDLDARTDRLRQQAAAALVERKRQALEKQAQDTALMASRLAHLLIKWAQRQQFNDEQMLPYQLVFIKSLRLAGDGTEALKRLSPLLERFSDDAEVAHHAGEIYFVLGGRENLFKATHYYDLIIASFRQAPYPEIWWNAWMRRFQIMDNLDQQTQDIPLRVRRLQRIDAAMGGERFARQFQRLANKHAR